MKIERIVNSFLQSNTFVLSEYGENNVYIIDVGDIEPLVSLLGTRVVRGLFLTHAHYDHVYGINKLLDRFPDCAIYGSQHTLKALKNDKLNFSYYYESPLLYKERREVTLENGQTVILWGKYGMHAIASPGHTPGSTSYIIQNNIFTGDAFIPNIPTVTKLKEGNKVDAEKTVELINNQISEGCAVYPGHLCLYKMINGVLQTLPEQ